MQGLDPNNRVGAACKEGPDNLSQFPKTRQEVIKIYVGSWLCELKNLLPPHVCYWNIHSQMDVLQVAQEIEKGKLIGNPYKKHPHN